MKAAALRKFRRRFSSASAQTEKWAADQATSWMKEIEDAWQQNRRKPSPDYPAGAETVAHRVREIIWNTLWNEFSEFTRDATAEERQFMLEVLNDHANLGFGFEDELPIAQCFEAQLKRRADSFIRCPEDLQTQVRSYIACLQAAQPCKDKIA